MSDGIIRLRLISRLELNLLPSNIPPVRYDSAYYRLYDRMNLEAFWTRARLAAPRSCWMDYGYLGKVIQCCRS